MFVKNSSIIISLYICICGLSQLIRYTVEPLFWVFLNLGQLWDCKFCPIWLIVFSFFVFSFFVITFNTYLFSQFSLINDIDGLEVSILTIFILEFMIFNFYWKTKMHWRSMIQCLKDYLWRFELTKSIWKEEEGLK